MEELSLSQRIAAQVLSEATGPSGPVNRATFLGVQTEIQRAIEEGWSVLAIHRTLQEAGVITFGYQAFRRYVKTLILEKKTDRHQDKSAISRSISETYLINQDGSGQKANCSCLCQLRSLMFRRFSITVAETY